MNGTGSTDSRNMNEGSEIMESKMEKMASKRHDEKTPSNVDHQTTSSTSQNVDNNKGITQAETTVNGASVDSTLNGGNVFDVAVGDPLTNTMDTDKANGDEEHLQDTKEQGKDGVAETTAHTGGSIAENSDKAGIQEESMVADENDNIKTTVNKVQEPLTPNEKDGGDELVVNRHAAEKVMPDEHKGHKLDGILNSEASTTKVPERSADGSAMDVAESSLPGKQDNESLVAESDGTGLSNAANETASDSNVTDKRQETVKGASSNGIIDENRQEEGDIDETSPFTADNDDEDAGEDSDDYVVSIESPTKNKESDNQISRTHSDGTTGSNYSAPVSPWAGLLSAVQKVKIGAANGNKQAVSEEMKLPKIEGSPVDNEESKGEEEEDSDSDVSVGDGHIVEFSSDLESSGSHDEKNQYLVDGETVDSGRETPRLKELSESASIAMSDLRNMLSVVNSRLKKEEVEKSGVKPAAPSRPKKEESEKGSVQPQMPLLDDFQETKPVAKDDAEDFTDLKGGLIMGYEADEEEVDDDDSQSSSIFLRKHTSALLLGDDREELAHKFSEHTYSSPTHCGICDGLLVGLWSQGLQCEICGLNVHRGEGINGHDDCRKEALLTPCCGKKIQENKPQTTLREVMKQSPNFFQDVKEQMNRDIKSQVKSAVVATGVEGERSKKLRRLRNKVVPLIETLDSIETRGEFFSFLVLMSFHIILVNALAFVSFIGFILALWPRHGFLTATALRSAFLHDCTVLCTVHVCLVFLSLFLRRMATSSKRKSNIFDQFLRDVFKIDAQKDLGVSVAGFTLRARSWSGRIVLSSLVTCCVTIIMWHVVESPVEAATATSYS